MILVAIDPGSGGTGYAWGNTALPYPSEVGVVSSSEKSWEKKAQEIVSETMSHISDACDVLAVEYPFIAGIGRAGASARRGDVIKLALLAGGIGFGFKGRTLWVPVQDWKGQMSKDLSTSRTRKRLRTLGAPGLDKLENLADHAWDAVGIWMFVQGSDMVQAPR